MKHRSVKIYDQLEAIEARKGDESLWPNEPFRHNFKGKTAAEVWGNPDGSLTIRSKTGKRLWKNFKYDPKVDGLEHEGKRSNPSIKVGETVRVNMSVVKQYDSMPPYIRLVQQVIRNGEGTPYVSSIEKDFAYIRAWQGDILGDIRVPLVALTHAR